MGSNCCPEDQDLVKRPDESCGGRAMRGVILAAGFGTRLASLGLERPKALLEVQGRPALEWILLALEAVEGLEGVDLVSNAKFYPQFEGWKRGCESPLPITIFNNGARGSPNSFAGEKPAPQR